MKSIVGCSFAKAKSLSIDKETWKEFEELARENPAETVPSVWGDKEEFIVETYYPIATTTVVVKMLKKINPEVEWTNEQVRAKARRMYLKKESRDESESTSTS